MAHTLVSREQLLLKSRKKWTVNGTSRIKPAQETFIEVTALAKKIGVTRLADITDMDILRIPNYSAILPGTEDYIWVYSGKGPTKTHAKVSALMESIERYSSLPSGAPRNFIQGSYDQLSSTSRVPASRRDCGASWISLQKRHDNGLSPWS